jgi:prepilin-type N-terminal cleavage/methylation domain-containing protein
MTLIELLVVIAIISLLAALLLPVLSGAKARSKQISCLQNLKQLEAAFQMYAADNGGKLVQNVSLISGANYVLGTNAWVFGNMKLLEDATNLSTITRGELFPYVSQPKTYHCPADLIEAGNFPRIRSYSMNSWIGSTEMETVEQEKDYRTFIKESDLAASAPASIWVFIDEHPLTLEDGWFIVTMTDTMPFERFPATRHQGAYGLDFADGHAEVYHLRTAVTQVAESQNQAFVTGYGLAIPRGNPDWIKLKQVTTSY